MSKFAHAAQYLSKIIKRIKTKFIKKYKNLQQINYIIEKKKRLSKTHVKLNKISIKEENLINT